MALRMRPAPHDASATLKGAQEWLTAADGAIERFFLDRLGEAFPSDGFQGEESGISRSGTLRWVVDPIDGTANYARSRQRFCVSLALLEDRTPLIGVLVAPVLGKTFAARRGRGATLNGAAIRVAQTRDIGRAMIECGWSRRSPAPAFAAMLQRLIEAGAMPLLSGSGALGIADVAAGRADAYVPTDITHFCINQHSKVTRND